MNNILDQIGEYREVEVEKEANGEKYMAKCLEACEDQQNEVAVTSSRLPNRQTMLKWSDFCIVMQKLRKSCVHVWKRIDLDRQYPSLCSLLLKKLNLTALSSFNEDNKHLCKNILSNFKIFGQVKEDGDSSDSSDEELLNALFLYSRENLALVNIYIKPPVVTRIMKDERIPVIWFVANCGGILGLCMGFSIVTVFEVLHYLCRTLMTSCSSLLCKKRNNTSTDGDQCKRSDTASTFLRQTTVINNFEHIEPNRT